MSKPVKRSPPDRRARARYVPQDDVRKRVTAPGQSAYVTRAEFVQATDDQIRQRDIRFRRIAQLQADIDEIKGTLD